MKTAQDLKLQIINFVIQNNLSFTLGPKISKFIANVSKNYSSKVIIDNDLSIEYLKNTKDKIAQKLKKELIDKLAKSYFSISIDSGCIKGNNEYLGITARYFETEDSKKT